MGRQKTPQVFLFIRSVAVKGASWAQIVLAPLSAVPRSVVESVVPRCAEKGCKETIFGSLESLGAGAALALRTQRTIGNVAQMLRMGLV